MKRVLIALLHAVERLVEFADGVEIERDDIKDHRAPGARLVFQIGRLGIADKAPQMITQQLRPVIRQILEIRLRYRVVAPLRP
jgi:hypothetical protein